MAQADLERDPYGLCRLVVTGYGGKDYGAVAAAVTDGLAILQYDTPLAARKAAVQLAQDGATAEPDSLCQLETDTNLTGNLCPWAGRWWVPRFLRPAADPGSPGGNRPN